MTKKQIQFLQNRLHWLSISTDLDEEAIRNLKEIVDGQHEKWGWKDASELLYLLYCLEINKTKEGSYMLGEERKEYINNITDLLKRYAKVEDSQNGIRCP